MGKIIKNPFGFTMIEILIVLLIMSTLTILSSQSIQQAIRSKVKIQTQNDEMSQVRDALKIIERDINLIFRYQDLELEMIEQIKKKKQQLSAKQKKNQQNPQSGFNPTFDPNNPNQQQNPQQPGGVAYPCPEGTTDPLCVKSPNRLNPITTFVGKENEISFATLNTGRVSENIVQADFVKVGYSVRSCKRPGAETSSQCLLRREDIVVEGDVTKGGEEVMLLDGVSEFKLRYFGFGKQDWTTDWSMVQTDGKGKFPDAVEVSLTVTKGEKETKKEISMQIVVPIRFPNNPEAPTP